MNNRDHHRADGGGQPGLVARTLALKALTAIEGGAYANLVLPAMLQTSGLSGRDRDLVTELVYGTTRMRRALDYAIDRFCERPPTGKVRRGLRLGTYQLLYLDVPDHAAISTTVDLGPPALKAFMNAVLRRVADEPVEWPSEAVRLSYPDWIVERLHDDLGPEKAVGALVAMNQRPSVTRRADGYVQDRASQHVVEVVDPQSGELVLDMCAAPGGKATAMASRGATVVAADVRLGRLGKVAENRDRLGLPGVLPVVADSSRAPWREASFDRVLVDAPCSGLGVLHRRPDARWRIEPADLDDLVGIQQRLLREASVLVKPGGRLVYSVCTLTRAETDGIDGWIRAEVPTLEAEPLDRDPWHQHGRGARLFPQDGTDGMTVYSFRRA